MRPNKIRSKGLQDSQSKMVKTPNKERGAKENRKVQRVCQPGGQGWGYFR